MKLEARPPSHAYKVTFTEGAAMIMRSVVVISFTKNQQKYQIAVTSNGVRDQKRSKPS